VRSYLLGTIEDGEAARVEERYFTDRRFFLFVHAIETRLIEDYLDGRLTPPAKHLFEARYLEVPDLRERVEEIRGKQVLNATNARRVRTWLFVVAAAIMLACIGIGVLWLQRNSRRTEQPSVIAETRPVIATLSLTPGLLKGAGSVAAKLGPLTGRGDVRLVLELPGQHTPMLVNAWVSVATSDGAWRRVWSAPKPIRPLPGATGQQVTLTLDSSLLPSGDYLVEIVSLDERVHESYSFHVSSA